MTESIVRLDLRIETDHQAESEELAGLAVQLRRQLEFSTPGEPTEGTYVISEIQADGTVKAIETTVCFPGS